MRHRNSLKTLLVAACLLLPMGTFAASPSVQPQAQTAPAFQEVTLSLGSITKNVIATGSLQYADASNITLPDAITLSAIDVEAGDEITLGQVLAQYDVDALSDQLAEAWDSLEAQDAVILELLGAHTAELVIRPAIAGVVKQLNLEEGQMVQASLDGKPAAVLSITGLMQVRFAPTEALQLGDSVRVAVRGTNQNGSVARIEPDGSVVVSFPDTRAYIDEQVTVSVNGKTLGEGKAELPLPYLLYTEVDGVVSDVAATLNSSVTTRSTIYRVDDAEPATDYLEALTEREELTAEVARLEALIQSPQLRSETAGIVAEVVGTTGTQLPANSVVLKVYANQALRLDVAVDELDILSMQVGQEGIATLDALSNAQLPVKVERISRLGTSSGGITNYTVSLSIQQDDRLMSGMNGTATLTVGQAQNAVLVPLAGLMSDRDGNFVMLKGETQAEGNAMMGAKTYVEVGVSDANYAAVTSGLKEGDVILIRPEAAIQAPAQNQFGAPQMMNPGQRMFPGGGRP